MSRGEPPRVAVCLVTHDSADDLPACLAAIGAQSYRPLELVVVDCASRDGSVEIARSHLPDGVPSRVVALDENLGFAGGMNRALPESDAPLVLMLNPDAWPAPDYVARLVARMEDPPRSRGAAPVAAPAVPPDAADDVERGGAADGGGHAVGAVTGRLLRPPDGGTRRLDACGMWLVPTWRHLDRGSGRRERGQMNRPERVFGATGAASLFRRRALEDAALEGEVLLAEFHTFREDAELCFRLRERRWEVLYEPTALCEHRRSNVPGRRHLMPPATNFHTLKNRYLLRAYHQGPLNLLLTLLPTLWRDLLALGHVLLRERRSLAAYGWLWGNRRRIGERRRAIRARRLAGGWEMGRWFVRRGLPLEEDGAGGRGEP